MKGGRMVKCRGVARIFQRGCGGSIRCIFQPK